VKDACPELVHASLEVVFFLNSSKIIFPFMCRNCAIHGGGKINDLEDSGFRSNYI
jgi:hypothetical protein